MFLSKYVLLSDSMCCVYVVYSVCICFQHDVKCFGTDLKARTYTPSRYLRNTIMRRNFSISWGLHGKQIKHNDNKM